jgi:hypothetical protein
VEQSFLEEKVIKKWTGRNHQTSTYRWINGGPLRDSKDALMVNYLFLEIWNEKTGKVGRRDSYFHHMQAALRYALHETWRDFLIFV